MTSKITLEKSYIVLIEFLMLSKRRVIQVGDEVGLTSMQTLMLFLLNRPRPMNEFKKILNCDASNVTGLVDGLVQKGLAGRYENKDDRRIKMVQLEPRGEQIRSTLLKNLTEQDSPIQSRLTPEEFETFINLLEKITDGQSYV